VAGTCKIHDCIYFFLILKKLTFENINQSLLDAAGDNMCHFHRRWREPPPQLYLFSFPGRKTNVLFPCSTAQKSHTHTHAFDGVSRGFGEQYGGVGGGWSGIVGVGGAAFQIDGSE